MIRLKGIIEEDLSHYKDYTLTLLAPFCNWKCCKEANIPIELCGNQELQSLNNVEYSIESIISKYNSNGLHSALCIAGFEPFETMFELVGLIDAFRKAHTKVPIIIYTGYTEEEEKTKSFIKTMRHENLKNIILKVGRFVPNCESHFDPLLGVNLCSPNQYAIQI